MQQSSSFYQSLSTKSVKCTEQEMVPPPYQAEFEDESLPRYMDTSVELEGILNRFAPRWDNQRIQHDYYNEKSSPVVEQTSHLLDRMEDYRHNDQEWSAQSQMKMAQMVSNMYHIQHKPSSSCCTATKKMPSLSSAKSKYQKITLSIAKEREHMVHRMKKMRLSPQKTKPISSSCKNDFDQFLNSIHKTSSQFEMPNQRATLIIPTI
ncbi:hypothetical protein BCR42DRAFT_143335 [Absidia repens]|uniref:Uncharacterized protein n=1 Tax=Absidia repens TaxID=90262 RepID=A0A1X2I4K4_9FUNG|nr:hypothetical protein BCR42DRAFT_143335 [Absidia repens]